MQSKNRFDSGANRNFDLSIDKRYNLDKIFAIATWAATLFALLVLAILLIDILTDGLGRLNWSFLTNFSSRRASASGILAPLVGTIWLLVITALISFPLGVGAGIFLEEYAEDNWFTQLIEINIANLAAVPSIIYGLLGLQIFVRIMEPITQGRTVLAGALTLSLLILPIIIITTREALRSVPDSLRQAGFALGANRWQIIREQIFPIALPGILTGTILALSRAIGETAPLIVIGAVGFITFLPELSLKGLQSSFTALPIQIFDWVSRPQTDFHQNAAAGIIILMIVLLLMNSTAIYLRNKFQQSR
ncbi:phosphate ABC transporter permease [Nostoc linckia z18]|uniref:Phosphate transport system permease protein PstA n=2 Tax=Nostoc linckia TaxID=92942 RepID=A0A9Q6EHM8_NOSLI|nr:phosphate ABC transporter permease [Nostoc linckia z1]PHJ72086.1 phosphate ABC transporter permease [Nostoc linckia z3]PHJ72785.1 phosphate ABC transporter permease [Nostoc linckia z4]PHJ78053.1 phosphate ABC transporter permease [Nostoc linckia z2]PHJ89853.1 phosphate ABC transporter permease [Nostoc linckia z6]PHJ94836.1 phosphate ABC transporter permease [Nostoc linckia z8]PHJ96398.1 phosphate ABC transporter permease [Nostoc linckia z7]PHK02682.1 phosphate ABC transporter permease [No